MQRSAKCGKRFDNERGKCPTCGWESKIRRDPKASDVVQFDFLSPVARRAWKRLESDFPALKAHLNMHDGELEFAIPAPTGSTADYLVAFSHENQLWVCFNRPYLCYPADDANEMVSLIKRLAADDVVFKVVMKGDQWVETTLTKPQEKPESIPGQSVRFISWSGKFDSNY
jgi:hypothetical protein